MWLSKVLLAVASAALTCASAIPDTTKLERSAHKVNTGGTCSSGDFVAPVVTGSEAGVAFCETNWGTTFTPVVTIEVWWVPQWVAGIRLTYADGSVSPVYGRTTDYGGQALGINYGVGERFTKVFIYGSPNYEYVKHLIIKTSAGQVLRAGVPVGYGEPGYGIPYNEQGVGDGFMVGALGGANAGYGLTSLGFEFLAVPVSSVVVTDLQFPNGPTGGQDLHPETLAQGHFFNSQTTGNSTWTFADAKTLTTTYTYTQASASMWGGSETITISGGIPMIITVSSATAFTWSYTYTETNAVANTKTVTVTWTESGSLAPGTGVACAALISTGSGTFPYTSTVTINLANGAQYTYAENGSLNLKDVSDAIVTVEDDNTPPSTPPNA